jgi:hypothetical protein
MARELQILVTARNMAGGVLRGVRGDVEGVEGAARRASSNVGRNVGLAVAAVGAGLAVQVHAGINSLVELEEAQAQTRAAIESTGGAAGLTADEIRAMSEAFERQTTIDDKLIQSGANVLLTFRNVREDAFEPAMEAALNLSTRMGGDLNGAILQVGKALEDPVRGITALRRAGISFTEAQQDQIKAMVEANDLAGAQTLILAELETQLGGSAAALGEGAGGAQRRWGDAIEDMQMHLATGFLPLIERASDKMQELAADPAFIQGIEDFGGAMAGAFESALDFAEDIPWAQVGAALQTAGTGARMAMDAFLGAPPWLQTAILTGWGLNKLTGGALGSIVGALGSGLIKGVLGMNAGVVNINAATVTGAGGGVPGVAGRGGGMVAGAVGTAGAAAVIGGGLLALEDIRTGTEEGVMRGMLSQGVGGLIGRALGDPIQELINEVMSGPVSVRDPEAQRVAAAAERGANAARDAIPWAQRNLSAAQQASARAESRAAVAAGNLARIEGVTRESVGVQRGILAKRTTFSPIIQAMITNQISINEWQRIVTSSVRAGTPMAGLTVPI